MSRGPWRDARDPWGHARRPPPPPRRRPPELGAPTRVEEATLIVVAILVGLALLVAEWAGWLRWP